MKSKEPYITCIVSKGRTFRVKPMEELVKNAVWFVPKDELDDYLAEYTMGSVQPCASGLANQRNDALEFCFEQDKICLMMDDDISGFTRIINSNKTEKISFEDISKELHTNLINSPLKIAGFQWHVNMLWFNPLNRISLKSSLPTAFLMIKPSKPRFDKNLELGEDTDFTLQHILQYGGALRINYMQVKANVTKMDNKKLTFKKTMKGGLEYNLEKQKKSFNYLRNKWGSLVKEGKTPYHVALRL